MTPGVYAQGVWSTQNALLDAAGLDGLPGDIVRLPAGKTLDVTGDIVWFPLTAVVRIEVGDPRVLGGWIDSRGAVGLMEAIDGPEELTAWVVEVGGHALAVPRIHVTALLDRSCRFSQAVMVWLSQNACEARRRAAYNIHCTALERVSRLIADLHHAHRYPDRVTMNQAEIARLTGVQRTTVCAVMVRLREMQLIAYARSRITVIDTGRLAIAA